MRHQPADKSQINRRPCFLPPTLGADISKYHPPKRDRLTCLGLDITDIRARFGRRALIDLVALMGNYAATAALLTAFDMQLDPGTEPGLPMP